MSEEAAIAPAPTVAPPPVAPDKSPEVLALVVELRARIERLEAAIFDTSDDDAEPAAAEPKPAQKKKKGWLSL